MRKNLFITIIFFPAVFVALLAAAQLAAVNAQVPVYTHHYDTLRTGWNSHETTLTASGFPAKFGALATLTFDDQIDAQPLIVPTYLSQGVWHDIVYVATASNTVYAVDSVTGAILLQRNLGAPVPAPSPCLNSGPNIGITSTPVIDYAGHAIYVMAYVNGSPPTYQLHALELSTLNDLVNSPNGVQVTASHQLTDGSIYTFNPAVQRQRSALLELNGIVYAGFTSFCDMNGNITRGWLLGWNAGTLTPLAANQLNDTQTTDPNVTPPFFLDTIWMSGAGIVGAGSDLFFSTGNSDCNLNVGIVPPPCPSQTTNNGVTNIQESVVRLRLQNQTTPQIVSIFTPSNVLDLDATDSDMASGGVMLFPTGNTTYPYLAAAAGKVGTLYLLDPQSMGTPLNQLGNYPCWCAPSFFTGSDGINRIVTSQGSSVTNQGLVRTWQVQMSPSPNLVLDGAVPILSGQDGGFFTSVSSNGTAAGSAIIWAVGRPTGTGANPNAILLYAFAGPPGSSEALTPLYTGIAGSWPNTQGNANIVPVVSDGKVYVASAYLDSSGATRGQLNIFGPCPTSGCTGNPINTSVAPLAGPQAAPHAVSGTILAASGSTLTLKTRTGKSATVDASQALASWHVGVPLRAGVAVTAQGSTITGNGALVAQSIVRAKGTSGGLWPPDR
jgi:hypothetical protein